MAAGHIDNDAFKKVQIPFILDEDSSDKAADGELGLGVWLALLNNYVETGKVPQLPITNGTNKSSVAANKSATTNSKSAASSTDSTTTAPTVRVSDVKSADLSALLQRLLSDARQRFIVVKSQAPEDKKWEHD